MSDHSAVTARQFSARQFSARNSQADLAAFILRVSLGAMFLAHGLLLKVFVFTLPGTAQYFASLGLPGWSAYVVAAAEIIGGVMLILGLQVRLVALALLPVLIGALWVHAGNGWVFTAKGGGWEYPAYLIVLSMVQALVGEGAFALSRSKPLPLPAPQAT